MIRNFLVVLTFLSVAFTGPALSRDAGFDDAQRAALVETVEDFGQAMIDEDYRKVITILPERVIDFLAGTAKVDRDVLAEKIGEMMVEAMAEVEEFDFSMDTDAIDYLETPSGRPYALIPTRTVFGIGENGKFEQKSSTLAILEEDGWRLLRVSEVKQVIILREVYPAFKGVEFPRGPTGFIE